MGDIFVMQPPDGRYLFGRVIDTNANPLGVGGAVLIYVYQTRSDVKSPPLELFRGQLLVPPMMTNRLPWTKGYFEHVENRPLTSMDRLSVHCFKDSRGRYFDEAGNPLSRPVDPVGQMGLHSFRTIDDEVSKAIALAVAPAP